MSELLGLEPQSFYVGWNTDPYQPSEAVHGQTRRVLEVLAKRGHSACILTKSGLVTRGGRQPNDRLTRLTYETLIQGEMYRSGRAVACRAPGTAVSAWLPQGASLESVSWPVPGEGAEIWLSLGYRVTGRGFAVHKRPAEGRWREVTAEEASAHVKVRGYATEHRQTSPEPGDEVSSTWNSVRWVEDAWCYVVEGDDAPSRDHGLPARRSLSGRPHRPVNSPPPAPRAFSRR